MTASVHREPTTTEYTVEARTESHDLSSAITKQASPIYFDTSSGQSTTQFGPAEVLAASFAACLLKNVERFSQILRFRCDSARVRVVATRADRPPRISVIRYTLHLSTPEPSERVDLLRRNLIRYGTIYNTLAAACEVQGEILTESPTDSDGPPADPPLSEGRK